jgi:hypothetical protein
MAIDLNPRQGKVDAFIDKGLKRDDRDTPDEDVKFTMVLTKRLCQDIDAARRQTKIPRIAWIRQAILERLAREGAGGMHA